MQILVGCPISPGYAVGTAVVYRDGGCLDIPHYPIAPAEVAEQLGRFRDALERSRAELQQLERRVLVDLGQTYSSIFSAHLALLADRQFTEKVQTRVENELINIEQALGAQVAELAGQLSSLENAYFQERAQDIRDLGNRLMRQLLRTSVLALSGSHLAR